MGNRKKSEKQKGMTLIGVLVGITILSIAMASQVRLLGNTIRREADMRNMIVATNLAREGVEIAFSWRVSEGWAVLKSLETQDLCSDIRLNREGGDCASKKLYPVGYTSYSGDHFSEFKAFLYDITPDSDFSSLPFWRTIRIEPCTEDPTGDVCLMLKSTVGWEQNKQVVVSKKIYNWYVP